MTNGGNGPDDDHPVWGVYNLQRTVRLRNRYYAAKMGEASRKNFWADILLAFAVPSSAVAGLPLWANYYGAAIWGTLTSIATVVSVAKPVLKFNERVNQYAAAAGMYRDFDGQLSSLATEIMQRQRYDNPLKTKFLGIQSKMYEEARTTEPLDPLDKKLYEKLTKEVEQEYPVDDFYLPPE